MTRYLYKKLADRYKNAQPLMVPFDAEDGYPKTSIETTKP